MIFSLFGKANDDTNWIQVRDTILALRDQFLAEGGDPVDFPDFLNEQGVTISKDDMHIKVSDEFITYAALKTS
jgi:hypothetical protein